MVVTEAWMEKILELVEHNVILCYCSPWQGCGNNRINYYLALNARGRSRARSASSTLAFLEIIVESLGKESHGFEPTVIDYGLLREVPSLWCHSYKE